jgi:DNA-binding NarL/FixJ family response regulator
MAGKNIFLIEDDVIYAEFLRKSLAQNGDYTINYFDNAEDALQALNGKSPDALIVDYRLPKMSGIEFFEKVKDHLSKEIKVILLSAIDDGGMVLSFIQKGVRDYVIKDETVIESLEAILSGKDEDFFLFS